MGNTLPPLSEPREGKSSVLCQNGGLPSGPGLPDTRGWEQRPGLRRGDLSPRGELDFHQEPFSLSPNMATCVESFMSAR